MDCPLGKVANVDDEVEHRLGRGVDDHVIVPNVDSVHGTSPVEVKVSHTWHDIRNAASFWHI
jgi:hypothetical protein